MPKHWKSFKTLFLNFHEGTGSGHEEFCRTFKKLVRTQSIQILIILRNFRYWPKFLFSHRKITCIDTCNHSQSAGPLLQKSNFCPPSPFNVEDVVFTQILEKNDTSKQTTLKWGRGAKILRSHWRRTASCFQVK